MSFGLAWRQSISRRRFTWRVLRKYDQRGRFLHRSFQFAGLQATVFRAFDLDITDYKGWPKDYNNVATLQDKAYANKLIKVSRDYELYRYDTHKGSRTSKVTSKGTITCGKNDNLQTHV